MQLPHDASATAQGVAVGISVGRRKEGATKTRSNFGCGYFFRTAHSKKSKLLSVHKKVAVAQWSGGLLILQENTRSRFRVLSVPPLFLLKVKTAARVGRINEWAGSLLKKHEWAGSNRSLVPNTTTGHVIGPGILLTYT
jgi:hypothetical protein